jgi:hypothetical protein
MGLIDDTGDAGDPTEEWRLATLGPARGIELSDEEIVDAMFATLSKRANRSSEAGFALIKRLEEKQRLASPSIGSGKGTWY